MRTIGRGRPLIELDATSWLRWRLLRPVTSGWGELLQHDVQWAANFLACIFHNHDTLLAEVPPSEDRHERNVLIYRHLHRRPRKLHGGAAAATPC